MRLWVIIFGIFLSFSAHGQLQPDDIITDRLTFNLDFGTYYGGSKESPCKVVVSHGSFPPMVSVIAKYKVEIFSGEKFGWYAFSTNRIIGGRGDCAMIKEETSSNVMSRFYIQNSGQYAPCFSNSKKSNPKGLKVLQTFKEKKIEVATLDKSGNEELSCSFVTD